MGEQTSEEMQVDESAEQSAEETETVEPPTETADAEAARQALEAAIADNPEEVVAFVERLGLVNDLLDTTSLATAALDDRMVMELAETSSLLAESADGLATPETVQLAGSLGENAADLDAALGTLVRLQQTGTLDELAQLADGLTLATAALDDEMVQSLARTGSRLGEVVDTAAEPETARGLQRALSAVGAAEREGAEPLGAVGLVRALRDEEVRRGMGFLVALARGLGHEPGDETTDR
ncbi:DUF1641 domain-containing protein [Halorarius litoreus]|uniref:DUF1641 domain-containing protein n=1 Tax=Halorarius litoreus TaxID=2962676 RepID=UPI0020CC2AFB|nr:DUF1641 domain-containing protein [Halorarius litoreus]